MKTTITRMLFTSILLVSGMFSFTFVDAQSCSGGKISVYKCIGGGRGHCVSKCVNPNNIPTGWSFGCPCLRLAKEQADEKLFTLSVSPNPVSSTSVIYFYLEQSEEVSLNIFDINGKLVTALAYSSFEEGDHQIIWNAADVNAGIYFLRFESASYAENRKLIVAK